MENNIYLIMGLCALILVWEISAMTFTRSKVKVSAVVPGQKLAMALTVLACIAIVWLRWGIGTMQLILIGELALACGLIFAIKHGLSDYGMYINGWSTPYKDMKYYDFERKDGELNRIRISCTKKDVTLMFTDSDVELAYAYFEKYQVPDMEGYKMLLRKKEAEKQRSKRR